MCFTILQHLNLVPLSLTSHYFVLETQQAGFAAEGAESGTKFPEITLLEKVSIF